MKTLPLILAAILLTSCATWSRSDNAFLAASWLAAGADLYTTEKLLDEPGFHENNPILGEHPSDTQLVTYMITSQIAATILAHFFPKYRKWILGGKTTINGACAVHNNNLD